LRVFEALGPRSYCVAPDGTRFATASSDHTKFIEICHRVEFGHRQRIVSGAGREAYMSIKRWDPMRELEDMSRRLNSMFGSSGLSQGQREDMALVDWRPSVDISETPEHFEIKAELPEVKKDDIKVTVEDGVLCIRGERKKESEQKDKKHHRIERSWGSFMRSFALPDDVDQENIAAETKDGVLTLRLAKSKKTPSKSVEVKVG
jgi:HSP20 family protein